MKKILFAAALVMGCMSAKIAGAQVSLNLSLNIGSQPEWGPVGYDHADYYYMPDVDAYYDVPAHRYVYYENNVWVHRTYLPARYRNYDVYNGYKVVINTPSPWVRNTYYRTTYAGYKGRGGQPVIRDSHEAKYQGHWKGNARPVKVKEHRDNGNHFGQRGGNGKHGGDRDNGNRGGGGRDNGNHGGGNGKGHGGGNGKGHGHD